jgi:tetratricopeptide (TPR) repeat protein
VRAAAAKVQVFPTLSKLIEGRHGDIRSFVATTTTSVELDELAERLKDPTFPLDNLGCQRPDWVAARLWEHLLSSSASPVGALREWYDYWKLLGFPSLVPHLAWDEDTAATFFKTAFDVLEHDYPISQWVEWRNFKLQQIALIHPTSAIDLDIAIPPIPETLVERAAWLGDSRVERHTYDDASVELCGLLSLTLADVVATDLSAVPNPIMSKIISLAIERPAFLATLVSNTRQEPLLLADLVLFPQTSALACVIVARWKHHPRAWDQQILEQTANANQTAAFRDCLSVFGSLLETGRLDPAEVAALFSLIHLQPGSSANAVHTENLNALRSVLAQQTPTLSETILHALTASSSRTGVGSIEFAAAVDLLDLAHLSATLTSYSLIDTYVSSVAVGSHRLSAFGITAAGAAALLELAYRSGAANYDQFIYAVNEQQYQDQIAVATEQHPASESAVRSIRTHTRFLSRAIAGSDSVADSVIDAACAVIRRGAREHTATSRVAAFAARFESWPYPQDDKPISADLGAALQALSGSSQRRLLDAILEIDEPVTLAKLLPHAPLSVRAAITKRLEMLTPENAAPVYSLTALQARIEALLSIGLTNLAALYMADEERNKRAGNLPGVLLTRLRASLHLKVLTGDWKGLADATVPDDMPEINKAAARDTLLFFKAVGAMRDDAGDRAFALSAFQDLGNRHPNISAYAVNAFAATVVGLLKDDIFGYLSKADRVLADNALTGLDEALHNATDLTEEAAAGVAYNRGRLLLAMGDNDGALRILNSARSPHLEPLITGFKSVAIARLGRIAEALGALDHADEAYGKSDFTKDIREYIRTGKQFATVGEWVLFERDIVKSTRSAWLELPMLDPEQQAMVLTAPGGTLESFIVGQVRLAAASLSSLAPMIKEMKLDSREEDLNSLFRQLLLNRLDFVKWSISDESRGGYSAAGGVGERDLTIARGTSELAVIEAMLCKSPLHQLTIQRHLLSHFKKVFGYSGCTIFFHVTYSYINDTAAVLKYIIDAVVSSPPDDFDFLDTEDLPLHDSQPIGTLARYQSKRTIISVIFLVIDMTQEDQRGAARAAGA